MMLVIRTQYLENYGAHDWDGQGECPQYWKAKGGSEYKVTGVPLNVDYAAVVDMAAVERSNDYVQEYIIDWSVEADDYLSEFERSQMEYEGEITYREPEISYDDLQSRYEDPSEFAERSADADAEYYGTV
jgi:hypothetical protein